MSDRSSLVSLASRVLMSSTGLKTNLPEYSLRPQDAYRVRGLLHLPDSFVDVGVLRQIAHFAGRELQQSDVTLLCSDLCLDNVDLLLCHYGLTLNLAHELWR